MSHTPGPWAYCFSDGAGYDCMSSAYIVHQSDKKDDFLVAVDVGDYVNTGASWDERHSPHPIAEANARLISSAPELLEACEIVATAYVGDDQDVPPMVRRCRAAVAKAKGESSRNCPRCGAAEGELCRDFNKAEDVCNHLRSLQPENERIRALLLEVSEFLDPFVDVRDGEDGPQPNKAMSLKSEVDAEIQRLHAKG